MLVDRYRRAAKQAIDEHKGAIGTLHTDTLTVSQLSIDREASAVRGFVYVLGQCSPPVPPWPFRQPQVDRFPRR